MLRSLLPVVLVVLSLPAAQAQSLRPKAPEKYDVQLRYRIRTDRDERIRQFRVMQEHLKDLGFVQTKRDDADLDVFDPDAELLTGTIPSNSVGKLQNEPNIKTVQITPVGLPPATDPAQMVPVRLTIAGGLAPIEQRILHEQVLSLLSVLGFQEGIAYDHLGFRIIRGSIAAGLMPKLLKDLRYVSSGWFFSTVNKDQIPSPLQNILPIRLIEVLPALPATTPFVEPTNLGKFSPDILAAFSDPAQADKPIVVEAALEFEPGEASRDARNLLTSAAPGASLEGIVGNIATIRLPKTSSLPKLASLQDVRTIRQPRSGHETTRNMRGAEKAAPQPEAVMKQTGLATLHDLGYRGQFQRIVVIASEFDGLEPVKETVAQFPGFTRVKSAGLKNAYYFDFTGEANFDLESDPLIPNRPGQGTPTAIAAAAAAPEATILLVRVDPAAFHQVLHVAKAVLGTAGFTPALQSRLEELGVQLDIMASRRRGVVEEYRKAFADLSDDEIPTNRRIKAAAEMKKLQGEESQARAKVERFNNLKTGLESLKSASVVVNTLVWEGGFAHDGLNALSRLIDASYANHAVRSSIKPKSKAPLPPVWIQAASTAVKQVWAGSFLDSDGNGVMEFAAKSVPVPKNLWTRELNFLAYEPADGATAPALPAGQKIRVSMQWREPHNREGYMASEPSFPMRLRLLKQIDPDAKVYASDEFQEVGRSMGIPVRLFHTPGSGAYEVSMDVVIPAEGIYAIRVEGAQVFLNQIPAIRHGVEIRPRIVVETLDPAQSDKGRVVFETYAPDQAGVAIPGDSFEAVTVGFGTLANPGCLVGAGPGVALRIKPDVFTEGRMIWNKQSLVGTGIAAGYAAGAAVSLATAGVRKTDLTRNMGLKPGDQMVLPEEWLKRTPPLSRR